MILHEMRRGTSGLAWLNNGSRTFQDSATLETIHVSPRIMPISSASAVFHEFSSSQKTHSHLTAKTVKAVASRRPQRCVRRYGVLPNQSGRGGSKSGVFVNPLVHPVSRRRRVLERSRCRLVSRRRRVLQRSFGKCRLASSRKRVLGKSFG